MRCEVDVTIEQIDARIGDVMGVLNGATAELVGLIATVVAGELWSGPGIRSPEHWVTFRCGVAPTRARRLVAMARRLAELPATGAVFGEGRLTEDQMAVLCRHLPAQRDAELADLAPLL